MRPCFNIEGLGLEWVRDLLPLRDPKVSADIRLCLDYFVHAMVCSLDKEGRPVSPCFTLATLQYALFHKLPCHSSST